MQQSKSSEAKQPLNIMLGSSTRFSQKKLQQNQLQDYSATGNKAEQEEGQHQGAESGKSISRFDQRKVSNESGGEYRSNLRKIRPRVDCWNRSATRAEGTPN